MNVHDPPSTGVPHLGPLPLPRWRSFRIRVLFVVGVVVVSPLVLSIITGAEGDALTTFAWATLLALPVALFLAWWLGWRTQRALNLLRTQAWNRVPHPSFSAMDIRRQDEVGDLALAINGLLGALAERHRANEAFVADLAHEFKNPVAAVRAAAESLGTRAEDERAQRLSRILGDASSRLDALVTQLLELARAEAGMPREERTRVDLAALARGVATTLASLPDHASIRLELDAASAIHVHGVPGRLESVIRNLVDNAFSFAGADGVVGVRVGVTGGGVELAVTDTGPGIAPGDMVRVFERFFTTRGQRRGTGLGLALSRAIVEAHGGTISVQSAPGQGTRFTVVLPATR